MNVVIIITNSDHAGAQMHVLSLLKGLKGKHSFYVITGTDGFLTEQCDVLNISYCVVDDLSRSISPIRDIASYFRIKSILKKLSPDIVHVHSLKASVIGRLAASSLSLISVYTVHGWAFSDGNNLVKRATVLLVEKCMSRFTNKFITVSNYDRNIAVGRIAENECIEVIHNGIENINNKAAKNEAKQQVTQLICVARLAKQKNIPCLLRATKEIISPFVVKIAGRGPLESSLKSAIVGLGVEDKVILLGEVDSIEEELAESDIFVLSSDWEGLPIALIEALRAGLPIVSTNVGGVSEIVEDGVNGFLVARGDWQSLSDKLNLLIGNEGMLNKFSEASKEKYYNKFQLEPMLEKTNGIYQSL